MEEIEENQTKIDVFEPIDFEKLKLGPITLGLLHSPYDVAIEATRCGCSYEKCDNWLVFVRRWTGVFWVEWLISEEDFLKFECLDDVRLCAASGGFTDSMGERQHIEAEAVRLFEKPYFEVEPVHCICGDCAKAMGEEAFWERVIVSQLASALAGRDSAIQEASETLGPEGANFAERLFDLGYSAGRIYSEYIVKQSIEADALSGQAYNEIKLKRAKASGERSALMRSERIIDLICHMERLVNDSPALARMGPENVASLACEDAASEKPNLWKQGARQLHEYIGEVRRGEAGADLQIRFMALFPVKPLKRSVR